MTVSGGIKFLTKSQCLYVDGVRALSLHGDNAQLILNHNRANGWLSTNSDDLTTEQIVIDLTAEQTIDRIILNQHNFKDVLIYLITQSNRVELETGSGNLILSEDESELLQEQSTFQDEDWVRFIVQEDDDFLVQDQNPSFKFKAEQFIDIAATPSGDTLQRTITDSAIDVSTSYYSFNATRVLRIILEVTETQTADQQKSLKAFIATSEIGTLEGYPSVSARHDRHILEDPVLSGKSQIQKGLSTFGCNINFRNYPGQDDADLVKALHDRDLDFLVWLCGGREGSTYFKYDLKGWEIDDVYLVNVRAAIDVNRVNNIYINPYNVALALIEVPG